MVSPTVRARQFGGALVQLRKAAGRTQKQAAAVLECSQSTIAQIEAGRTSIRRGDFMALMAEYGVAPETVAQLDGLRTEAREPGRWPTQGLPDWLTDVAGLEGDALTERAFELELIPGILQTEAYAREVHELRGALTPKEGDTRVAARIQRQVRLTTSVNPLDLSAVLSQSALERCIGKDDPVGAGQLRHLCDLARLPNVRLQVVPFSAGRHPAMQGAFTILSFPDGLLADVAWQEYALGGHILDDASDVASLTSLYNDEIRSKALGCDESLAMLADLVQRIP